MSTNFAPGQKKQLREAGCRVERQSRGDREIWFSPRTGLRFPVDRKIKSRRTANAVLKQAGLPKRF
ncbi:MAG TPA: type II toxin-antitoxin system HicA family toxin [Gammaproteobacteria bacterium]|nr:type II toxin-antitoxin system HicA family toxin [Gammaproteobacteria bacterium]